MTGADAFQLDRADFADVDAVMAVMNAAFDPRFGEAWTAEQVRTLFAVPGTQLCLAQTGTMPVGFYAARLAGPESELLLVAVDPCSRRQGVGAKLIAHWLDWGRAHNVEEFFLEMRADNPAAALYKQSGFAECGRRPDYYTGNDGIKRDAITMRYLASPILR